MSFSVDFFFFKQKTAYEMRISDWSSDVCSSDLGPTHPASINVAQGNLGLSACGLFTRIIVTHVSIRTSDTSSGLLNPPSPAYGTLLYRAYRSMHTKERKSVVQGKSVSVRVDIGGRSIIKKKISNETNIIYQLCS